MRSNNKRAALPQAGFTLVEIMVGLVIGLLATIIIMKVLSVFETQKRTTTGSADAQVNGNIALYDIERDMQMAGYPLMPYGQPGVLNSGLKCTNLYINGVQDPTVPNRLTPVVITDGGANGSDTITIRYGTSASGGIPVKIGAPSALSVPVSSSFGCNNADVALFINNGTCAITTLPATGAIPDATHITLADNTAINAGAVVTGANMSCLGNVWNEVTYAVNTATGNLERTIGGVTTPIIAGIVNLQAQYGIAAAGLASTDPNFNQVVQWVNATSPTWNAPTVAQRNLIKAIRIAVVARSAKQETSVVTTNIATWTGTATSPAPTVNLSASYPQWNHYRYRVFDTIIPIRNVIWSKGTL